MRTATVGMGGQRLLAILTAMAVITSLMVVLATPAQAHTPDVDEDCHGWSVELLYYNTNGDNSLKIWIDDVIVVDLDDFGANQYESGTWDPTEDHTIKVEVKAWDDPTGSKGWSFTYEGASEACEEPPQDRFACVNGEVIPVGHDEEGYDEAYDTREEAAKDPACMPTTTTLPPTTTTTTLPPTTTTLPPTTTTLPNRWVCDDATDTAVEVGPNDPGYGDAYDTKEEALDDEDCVEVEGTVVTTVPTTVVTTAPETEPEEELPFTGIDSSTLIGASVVLLGLGALLLTVTRRQESN
jgi:hypothetical protein